MAGPNPSTTLAEPQRDDGLRSVIVGGGESVESKVAGESAPGQKATEDQRVEEELRESIRRKDEFLATLAHELRNPLAPISNALEIMAMADIDPSTQVQMRQIMMEQVRQLKRLIDDLLDVSRITSGK